MASVKIKSIGCIFIALVCFTSSPVCALPLEVTNVIPSDVFVTDDGFLFFYKQSGERVVQVKKIEEAKKSPLSRPADLDTDGHWGKATNGFQLSLRFQKTTFTNDEPIVAIMYMRNVTNSPESYFRPTHVVVSKEGKMLKEKNDIGLKEITMFPEATIFPQTQQMHQEDVNQHYDLKEEGIYIFQAVCNHPEVSSQPVTIWITNSVP